MSKKVTKQEKAIDKELDDQEKEIAIRPGPLSAPITCSEEYLDMSVEELSRLMPPHYFRFAVDVANHKNQSKA